MRTDPVRREGLALRLPTLLPWACVALLFAIDLAAYRNGVSWSLLHYESLIPLSGIVVPGWKGAASAIGSTLLVLLAATLYFAFGLTFELAATSWLFLAATGLASALWLVPLLAVRWQAVGNVLLVASLLALLVWVDKGLSRDQFSSSFTPHFVGVAAGSTPKSSANEVYRRVGQDLDARGGAVLIVFEGLGVAPAGRPTLDRLAASPGVEVKEIPHEGGSTVPAEVRYLCGQNGKLQDGRRCLPASWRSVAVHGNVLSYFSRHALYKTMGFTEALGRRELEHLATCRFAYLAVCDRDLLDYVVERVESGGCTGLMYVLTIDSHFPYSKYERHIDGLYEDLELWVDALRSLSRRLNGCPVHIAGDHPPPLAPGFDRSKVLYVTIESAR